MAAPLLWLLVAPTEVVDAACARQDTVDKCLGLASTRVIFCYTDAVCACSQLRILLGCYEHCRDDMVYYKEGRTLVTARLQRACSDAARVPTATVPPVPTRVTTTSSSSHLHATSSTSPSINGIRSGTKQFNTTKNIEQSWEETNRNSKIPEHANDEGNQPTPVGNRRTADGNTTSTLQSSNTTAATPHKTSNAIRGAQHIQVVVFLYLVMLFTIGILAMNDQITWYF